VTASSWCTTNRALDRTTTLTGPIGARDADELRTASVPTLAEVLDRYQEARVIVELKSNHPDLAIAAVREIQRAGAVDRVCVGSFGRRVLRAVRSLAPAIATSAAREEVRLALYRSWCRWPVSQTTYRGYQIPEFAGRTRVVSPRFVADAHRAGLFVQVWTVDTAADARTAARVGRRRADYGPTGYHRAVVQRRHLANWIIW
jgi:glycerophosphoryl diester phosphodiesterase